MTHIGNMVFGVFASMELEVRQYLSRDMSKLRKMKPGLQEKIASKDDMQFYWALVSAGWDEEEGRALLEQIIDQYVTIRGFSFATGWMEKYKQAQKKCTQKSKGMQLA